MTFIDMDVHENMDRSTIDSSATMRRMTSLGRAGRDGAPPSIEKKTLCFWEKKIKNFELKLSLSGRE